MQFPQDIKAVILDMDGTLLNTEPLHAKAIETILVQNGLNITAHEIEERFYGMSDTEVFKSFENSLFLELDTFLKEKNKLIKNLISQYSYSDFFKLLIPGVFEFLTEAKKRNIKLALVSASENEVIEAILSHLKLKDHFVFYVGRQHTQFTKPNPSPYFLALRLLEVKTDEALIFEDSPSGLKSALGTGAKVVQVTTFSPPLKSQVSLSIDNFSCITFAN